ncbi:MAG: primosomal protein N', partial [Flavobacteriales bacterium]|nr:primosomal protein N' [Flavobacteriales bacterium]
MISSNKYIDVILPLALPKVLTYSIEGDQIKSIVLGGRVIVPLGQKKLYSGLVMKIHDQRPKEYNPKPIESILDHSPIVLPEQLKLWRWIAKYYMCHLGEVMIAAMPSPLKLSSESRFVMGANDHPNLLESDREIMIHEAIKRDMVLSAADIQDLLGIKSVHKLLQEMVSQGKIGIYQEVNEKYTPRKVNILLPGPLLKDEEATEELFKSLEKRAPKQLETLMQFLQMIEGAGEKGIERSLFIRKTNSSAQVVKTLIDKAAIERKEIERTELYQDLQVTGLKALSAEQNIAYKEVVSAFELRSVCLLHGITGSGKTEIYIKLIEDYLKQDKRILYLLPEIALTTQIINRLKDAFGDMVAIFHSRMTVRERTEIWYDLLKPGKYKIILGARSAVFTPIKDLGLIIVDEEHDMSYKQVNPAPRYNARDTAIVWADFCGAKVLLGSATPALESIYNAKIGRYALVELKKRYGGLKLPEVFVADLKEARRKKQMHEHFSKFLLDAIKETLEQEKQVILFQNRRGYSPYVQCMSCSHIPECKNCDVSLTYHKFTNTLRCHYCGYMLKSPSNCFACGSNKVHTIGLGTERIEEELELLLPEAKIRRMDLDTTRGKNAFERIITSLEDKEIDILVGTQMVTKGLDFDNVALVGILNADDMLYFPDFRAHERSFQLISQVAGRAGRKSQRGKVIIQTYTPDHAVIDWVIRNDYEEFIKREMTIRNNFRYPPYCRIFSITIRHKLREIVDEVSLELAKRLRKSMGSRILGP